MGRLLAQHRDAHVAYDDVVALTVGIKDAEERVRVVVAVDFAQQPFRIAAQPVALLRSLSAHAPCVVEVNPVDIGFHLANLVCDMSHPTVHAFRNWMDSPR